MILAMIAPAAQHPAQADAADQSQQADEQQQVLEHDPSFHGSCGPGWHLLTGDALPEAADGFNVGGRRAQRQYQISRRAISI
jgi:hypothetical protein